MVKKIQPEFHFELQQLTVNYFICDSPIQS